MVIIVDHIHSTLIKNNQSMLQFLPKYIMFLENYLQLTNHNKIHISAVYNQICSSFFIIKQLKENYLTNNLMLNFVSGNKSLNDEIENILYSNLTFLWSSNNHINNKIKQLGLSFLTDFTKPNEFFLSDQNVLSNIWWNKALNTKLLIDDCYQ